MTYKVQFRELKIDDVNRLFEIYSDKEAMKYRGSKPMERLEDAIQYIKEQELLKDNVLTIRKGIELLNEQELIGSVMYRYDKSRAGECEIGYSIGRAFWGQGFGKETVAALLTSIQEHRAIEQVIAWSNKENVASIKLLERNGFERIQREEHSDNHLFIKKI